MKTRMALLFLALTAMLTLVACSKASPSAVVKSFYGYVEKEQYDKAAALFSQKDLDQYGIAKIQSLIEMQKQTFAYQGGVKSLKITRETIIRNNATVELDLIMGDGSVQNATLNLVKEDDGWRIRAAK